MSSRIVVLAVASILSFVACGGGDGGNGESIEGGDVVVEMYDNRYQYTEIRIPVGGTVTWVGAGRNPHNAHDAEETWSTQSVFGSPEMLEGDRATLTFDEPGRYTFFCTFHGNAQGAGMSGVLIVGDE